MSAAAPVEIEGPLLQSIRIAFLVLSVATVLLGLAWAASGIRTIGPGTQAVVLRFGAVVRTVPSGLVLAWPRPVERLVLLPGGARQMQLRIAQPAPASQPPYDPENGLLAVPSASVAPDAAVLITADGEIVRLDTTLTWRITDASAYYVARDHVAAALRRLFLGAAVEVAASHPLDDFLSVRPERAADPLAAAARVRLRQELLDGVNLRLDRLARAGAPLGVAVTRADITPLLPEEAKPSFDAVLDAAQRADQGLAIARTDAAQRHQAADHERDRILTDAHAQAAERIAAAQSTTAAIAAYETRLDILGRPSLLRDIYLTRITAILRAAGKLDLVPAGANGGPRLILPAPHP